MTKNSMTRCSTSVIIRDKQSKITPRYCFTPICTAIIQDKKPESNKCWQGLEEVEPLSTTGRSVKCTATVENNTVLQKHY